MDAFWEFLDRLRDLDALTDYVRGLGAWGPVVSILVMVAQSVFSPIPGALIVAANGVVFGPFWGTLISWTGAMLGATAAFWIARTLGAGVAQRLAGRLVDPATLANADGPAGFWSVLLARLIPGLSFDLISYIAGLSALRYPRFILATAIGSLPNTAIISTLGNDLARADELGWRAAILIVVLVCGALFGIWYRRRQKNLT